MTYYLISNSDGDTTIRKVDKERVIELIKEEGTQFAEELPNVDTNYWGGFKVIISGEIVVPRPIERVVDWEMSDAPETSLRNG